MIYKVTPNPGCKHCRGSGTVYDTVPYGSTTAQMPSDCSCIEEQLPEEFDEMVDEIEIISTAWAGGDGPEYND